MNADITPERIADHLRGGEVFENRQFAGYVDVATEGTALRITFTPKGEPHNLRHFRAVITEGETVPDLDEVERLKTRLAGAKAAMRQALAVDSHPVMAHLLRLYLSASEGAEAEKGQSDA